VTGDGTSVSGFGAFSFNGFPSTLSLGSITAFEFTLTLGNAGYAPPGFMPVFDFTLTDLESFSATVSGGVVTALSFQTGFEFASNSDAFEGERLTVNSLAVGGANNDAQNSNNPDIITVIDNGTITTTGPGSPVPEPSSLFLAGGGAVVLAWKYAARRQKA
jgi:hypothetical protein